MEDLILLSRKLYYKMLLAFLQAELQPLAVLHPLTVPTPLAVPTPLTVPTPPPLPC